MEKAETEVLIAKMSFEDAEKIGPLALENGGSKNLTVKNIENWYYKNPVNSKSMWKIVYQDKIEGFATTNNFYQHIDDKVCLVAFPQNVLTSTAVRGKGLFGKLYYKTEEENFEENKVDCFFTFTGDMSTQIFLKKFDYLKGVSPKILMKSFSFSALFSKKKYKEVNDLETITFDDEIFQLANARQKDLSYFKWRYSFCDPKNRKVILIEEDGKKIGYAILISKKKFGIKTLILADIICASEEDLNTIINTCHAYAARRFAPLMMFELSHKPKNKGITFSLKPNSTFLVKGKTKEETESLSKKNINFFFGDIDYFW